MSAWFEYWGTEDTEPLTIEVVSEGFSQPAGFIHFTGDKMTDNPTPEEIFELRESAALQEVLPTVQKQIDNMKRSAEMRVFKDIREGSLTPDAALSYWMEMYSYSRLSIRLSEQADKANSLVTRRTE